MSIPSILLFLGLSTKVSDTRRSSQTKSCRLSLRFVSFVIEGQGIIRLGFLCSIPLRGSTVFFPLLPRASSQLSSYSQHVVVRRSSSSHVRFSDADPPVPRNSLPYFLMVFPPPAGSDTSFLPESRYLRVGKGSTPGSRGSPLYSLSPFSPARPFLFTESPTADQQAPFFGGGTRLSSPLFSFPPQGSPCLVSERSRSRPLELPLFAPVGDLLRTISMNFGCVSIPFEHFCSVTTRTRCPLLLSWQ